MTQLELAKQLMAESGAQPFEIMLFFHTKTIR